MKFGIGVGVMIVRDGRLLLGLRNPDKVKASSELQGQGTWTMPGGKVDFGETLLQAAVRETKEETGIEITDAELITITDDIVGEAHYVTAGFKASTYEEEPLVIEPETITEWRWFLPDELPENLYSATRNLLDQYTKGKVYGD
jgi:8-oxo-dGTP diphosphatase